MKWFSALYVVLIVVQVYLAGEGIFGLNNIKHDCDKTKLAAHCLANSKTLDAHRGLGFILAFPLAILFLICALLAWHPDKRIRNVSIIVPILTFLQMILPALGRWGGGLHPVNAVLVLGMFGWLAYRLRQEAPETATSPVTVPSG
jgi:uncharacterized membrane protein